MSPSSVAAQKAARGRSPLRSTAITAVAAGSRPAIPAACAAGTSVSAQALNNGNPTTTPTAVSARRGQRRRGGNR
jgi:hypothetical protein